LHRRPDRHPTIVSSLNTFRRDTPGINTQVTALQRGYLRRSETRLSLHQPSSSTGEVADHDNHDQELRLAVKRMTRWIGV